MSTDRAEPRMGWGFVQMLVDEGHTTDEAYEIADAPELTDEEWGDAAKDLGRGMVADESSHPASLQVLAAYYGAKQERRLNDSLVLEYRCRVRRDLLLHCWVSPRGRWVVLPPYRWSAGWAGDAERSRPARAINLDSSEQPLIPLDCKHVSLYLEPDVVLADAMLGRPKRRHVVRFPRDSRMS